MNIKKQEKILTIYESFVNGNISESKKSCARITGIDIITALIQAGYDYKYSYITALKLKGLIV